MDIKELIAMYAPTILMVAGTLLNYLKVFKSLNSNVSKIENSNAIKAMNKRISDLQFEIVTRSKYLVELKESNDRLMLKIDELEDKLNELEINTKNETIEEEKVLADNN